MPVVRLIVALFITAAALAVGLVGVAQADDPLAGRQASVAERFAKLETLLLRLADVEAVENPERAALLQRVVRQAREKFILEQLRNAGDQLESKQFAAAIDGQRGATADLQAMLRLLMSEDRGERIRDEKRRVAELVKQLRLTQREQRSIRARNEAGVELKQIADDQQSLTEKAEEQLDEVKRKRQEREPPTPSEGDQPPAKPSDPSTEAAEGSSSETPPAQPSEPGPPSEPTAPSESSDSQPPESQPPESQPPEGESSQPPSESPSPKEDSPPPPGGPSGSTPPGGSPERDEGPKPPAKPPSPEQIAETQMQKAIERMQQAEAAVEKADRESTTQEQQAAEEELRLAIDQLEKILRQLREEEVERELAKLDVRLRMMLEIQNSVLGKTEEAARVPADQRGRSANVRAGQLAVEEQSLTAEADRATLLLREEGSSVAFPEVIAAIRRDAVAVTARLDRTKIDGVTQSMMTDIVEAIEEMIEAVAEAKKDAKEKKEAADQPPGQGPPPGPQEQPLVQSIAELKLLRSMQTRIQRSTDRMAGELGDEGAATADASATAEALRYVRDLSERQGRLYRVTRDLVARQGEDS